jgi:16S rRNA (guanine527-N7)-methyltransferase
MWRTAMADVAAKLGLQASLGHEGALVVWLDTLAEWNAKMDLTAARDPLSVVWLMCADAWMLARVVPQGASVVDVGTGGGAPGLALAIMRPDLRVTLVETLGKRVAFLRTVIGKLGRMDIALVDKTPEKTFDVAMSRATFPPETWLGLGMTLAPSVWLFLAQQDPPSAPGAHVAETLTYVDASGATKRLVRLLVSRAE